ncbi:MAG: PKD domain-containing protein, partial [Saprospiraceae bacterium]
MNANYNLYLKVGNPSLRVLMLFLCFLTSQIAKAQIAYVANNTGGNVTVVNLATGATKTIIRTIDVSGAPLKIVGSPDGTNQRLAVISSDAISFLLLEQDSIVHFTAGTDLRDVLYSSDGLNLYTIDKSSNVIKPFDAITFTTINYSVPSSGDAPQAATFDPNTGNLVVINNGSNNLSFFSVAPDPDTPSILRIAQVSDNIAVGQSPQDIVYLPDGRAYVSNFGSNNITIINTDGTTNTIGGLNQPTAMILSPDGAFVYAINQGSNSVAVIDANTNDIVKNIPVGTMPRDLATTSDGAFVVVANQGSNSLSVIDASVNNVIRTISNVGSGPVSIAILDPFVFADFIVEIPPGNAPVRAKFNASASSASLGIAKYEWFFDDGFTIEGDTVSRVYNQNGVYTAVLFVTDSSEVNSASKSVEFSIPQNDPPVARIQVSSLDVATRTVVLNASESSDADGNIVSYTWNFGDDTPEITTNTPTVTHTYAANAGISFTISLVVEDNNSAKGQAETTISFNRLPVALFTISPTMIGIDSLMVTLDAATSSDPEGSSLMYSWDFGDGSDFGEGVSVTHTYTDLGTFPIVLTVTDELGGTSTATKEVTVHGRPEAQLVANPVVGSAPLTVNFDASTSTDDGSIVSYSWDFGDGSAGSGVTTSHTYNTVGDFTVVLTVTDNLGATDTATVKITASANPAPVAIITADQTSGLAPLTVNFDAGTSTDDGSIVSYSWDFGDGSVGSGVTTSHTYNTVGDFTVVLTVTDNLGATDTATV